MNVYVQECDKDLIKLVDNYECKLSEIDNEIEEASRSDVVKRYIKEAERLYDQLLPDIDNACTKIEEDFNVKINRINNSNLNFMKAIR